jgi:hypothetical protein
MRKLTLCIAILAITMIFTGCDDDGTTTITTTGIDDYDNMDMNMENGGLTMSDENSEFGDVYFRTVEFEDDGGDTGDPLQEDLEVLGYESEAQENPGSPDDPTKPKFTFLKVTFGQLDGLPEDVIEDYDLLDWSGMLSVDRGIVVVRRLIRFERPYDHLIIPRPNRQTVGWIAHTGPHFDGLLVEIIEPPVDPDLDPLEPNMLHFESMSFSTDFNLEDVAGMDELYTLDTTPGQIRFEGFRLGDLETCPKGFLSGLWRSDDSSDGGVFKGHWVGLFGRLKGLVKGRYGINDEGENVFFGKYISRSGEFRGLVRGHWQPTEQEGHGRFLGHWIGSGGSEEGVLGGRYLNIPDRPNGFFSGRWATFCDENASGSIE